MAHLVHCHYKHEKGFEMRRRCLTFALAVASALGASSLSNGSISSLPGSTDAQDGAAPELHLAPLGAAEAGSIDSFYLGNEAGHTNPLKLDESLMVESSASDPTAGKTDAFFHPAHSGWIGMGDDTYAGFGLCADGGASVGSFGGCAYDYAISLSEQLHFGMAAYGSLGFATPNEVLAGTFGIADPLSFVPSPIGTSSPTWGLAVGHSGVQDDYPPDDYGAIKGPDPVSVPEPATISLLGIGLLGLAAARRRRTAK